MFAREIGQNWKFNPDENGEALALDGGIDIKADAKRPAGLKNLRLSVKRFFLKKEAKTFIL